MSIQIAVKLPEKVVGDVDALVEKGLFRSRSEFVRSSIEASLRAERNAEIDRRYVEAYTKFPETDEEIEEINRRSVQSIEEEPWEKWW